MKGFYEIKGKFFYPQSIRTLGFLALTGAIALGYYQGWGFFFLSIIGLYFMFCVGGTQIDFENSRIRDFQKIFRQKIGQWEKLPNIEYVSFFRAKEAYEVNRSNFAPVELGFEYKYKVNFIYEHKKVFHIFESDHYKSAFKIAKEISEASGLRLYIVDGESEPKWL